MHGRRRLSSRHFGWRMRVFFLFSEGKVALCTCTCTTGSSGSTCSHVEIVFALRFAFAFAGGELIATASRFGFPALRVRQQKPGELPAREPPRQARYATRPLVLAARRGGGSCSVNTGQGTRVYVGTKLCRGGARELLPYQLSGWAPSSLRSVKYALRVLLVRKPTKRKRT